MKVFCCQHDIVWEKRGPNHAKVKSLLAAANIPRGSLVLLAEMFACGFSLDIPAIAEGAARETEKFLADTARELGVFLLGGIVGNGANGRGRNEAVVFSPEGREVARYCKTQPFAPGGEAAAYEAGTGPILFNCGECVVSPFICYDLRFPEVQRPAGKARAQLLTFVASWPDARLNHWVKLLQARAIENQCWVAGVNRIGSDPQFHYSGRSLIVNHQGEIVADAGDRECVIGAELDLAGMEAYRRDKPFLADLRPDFVVREARRV
ncbi:MAG: carbon-nitrogen family hydrolase [Verrucomicrobia bacterium]|nr:carbon-nitrogen family hydrolase [Verrucomicrobiota bacterium]